MNLVDLLVMLFIITFVLSGMLMAVKAQEAK